MMTTMITTLIIASALAAPPGYSLSKESSECKYYTGPAEADGIVPLFAECVWADVPYEKAVKYVADWELHDDFFGTVKQSRIVKTVGDKALVHQLHFLRGISQREVLMWGQAADVDGGKRFSWKAATDEPLTLGDGNVQTARHEGYWHLTPATGGGTNAKYHLIYGPGGKVPGFLIRWFQTSGLVTTTTDLHSWLQAAK